MPEDESRQTPEYLEGRGLHQGSFASKCILLWLTTLLQAILSCMLCTCCSRGTLEMALDLSLCSFFKQRGDRR